MPSRSGGEHGPEPSADVHSQQSDLLSNLDAAQATRESLSSELAHQRAIALDPQIPLDQRMEAFEDVFDSEVGDTALVRARNIERDSGLRQLYLKFDGGNPTGTQKDRIAFAQDHRRHLRQLRRSHHPRSFRGGSGQRDLRSRELPYATHRRDGAIGGPHRANSR